MAENLATEAFKAGYTKAQDQLFNDILEKYGRHKMDFIQQLFQNAPRKTAKQRAYAEGLRHALNILESSGSPLVTYKNIINNKMPMDVDSMQPVQRGH